MRPDGTGGADATAVSPPGAASDQATISCQGPPTVAGGPAGLSAHLSPPSDERDVVAGEIARGGMGAVLRAVDRDIRREVAIKYLLNQTDADHQARFVEEAQITGQLEHPNIVPVHELGIDADGRLYFTMKMVRGRSLKAVLDELRENSPQTAWTLGRLLNVLVNVCHALSYAHSRGVVHRDLKPANIMIGDFGEVYVMDWGLAKVLPSPAAADSPPQDDAQAWPIPAAEHPPGSSSSSAVVTDRSADDARTMAGTVLGTPVYMPPEQAARRMAEIDQRSDIYSVGAILYELLTLCPPVDRDGGPSAVLQRVIDGQIDPPERRAPHRARQGFLPGELSAIAMKALSARPADRYPTVEALRRDLELYLEGRAVSAKEDTFWETFIKLVRRNQGASLATAVAFGVLTIVLATSSWINYQAKLRAEQLRQKSDENHAAYLNEQEDKRRQGRESVPAFVRAAAAAIDKRRYDDALAHANVAADFDPDHAEARLLRGQLLIVKGDYAAAHRELAAFLQLQPGHAGATALAELRQARTDDVRAALCLRQGLHQTASLCAGRCGDARLRPPAAAGDVPRAHRAGMAGPGEEPDTRRRRFSFAAQRQFGGRPSPADRHAACPIRPAPVQAVRETCRL